MAEEVTRSTIWSNGRERLVLIECDDRSLVLLRASTSDDGPSRSCPIAADALGSVIASLQHFRACGAPRS